MNLLQDTIKSQNNPDLIQETISSINNNATTIITTNSTTNRISNNSNAQSEFNFESFEDCKCLEHGELKMNILLEDVLEYKKFTALCNICLSKLKIQAKRQIDSFLFSSIIQDHKEQIIKIKSKQLSLKNLGLHGQCKLMFNSETKAAAQHLSNLCAEFESQFISKLCAHGAQLNVDAMQIKKIKEFIESIELLPNGDPNLNQIGAILDLKLKYIKLAGFLLRFDGFEAFCAQSLEGAGLSADLKTHIALIVEARESVVAKVTEWLRFLLGPFYEHVFESEKTAVDVQFRDKYTGAIEFGRAAADFKFYINANKDYLGLLEQKRVLESENSSLRTKIATYKSQLERSTKCHTQTLKEIEEFDSMLNSIRQELETHRLKFLGYENTISSNVSSITALKNKKQELNTIIIKLQQELSQRKSEAESYSSLKANLENKIESYLKQISDLRLELEEHQINFSGKKANQTILNNDNDVLKTEINNLNLKITGYERVLDASRREKLELLQKIELLKLQIDTHITKFEGHINQFTLISKQKDELNLNFEKVSNELADYKAIYAEATKERYALQTMVNRLLSELSTSSLKIETHISQASLIIKERDDFFIKLGEIGRECESWKLKYEQLMIEFEAISAKLRDEEANSSTLKLTLDSHLTQVTVLTRERDDLRTRVTLAKSEAENSISELKAQLEAEKTRKAAEIHKLSITINTCKEEFLSLFKDYEALIAEIRVQIEQNEHLKAFVFELVTKIESHNQSVGILDSQVRQQIEGLTRQSLSKKQIDSLPCIDVVRRCEKEMQSLVGKIGRLEAQQLNKSQVFSSIISNISENEENKSPKNNVNGFAANGVFIDTSKNNNANSLTTTNFNNVIENNLISTGTGAIALNQRLSLNTQSSETFNQNQNQKQSIQQTENPNFVSNLRENAEGALFDAYRIS